MFRVSRSRRDGDRTLDHRMALFAAGAAAALAGIGLDIDWLVTVGIVPLGAGLLLGVRERRRDTEEEPDGPET